MAIFKEYDIIVDLLNGSTQDRRIVFDQNDVNTSKLNITLTNKAVPIDITGTTVTIAFLKRDKTTVYQPCTITNAVEGEVEVILSAQTLAVPGLVKADITIDSGTSTVTTSAFFFNVKDSIMNDQTVQSANEFGVIKKAIDAGEILGDIDLETIVNNTNNVNSVKSEVETARGGKVSLDTRLDDIDTVLEQNRLQLTDSNKQSQVLTHGTQLINATQNSPVDFEIQGRTLIPLQNSNMEASKYYVLADKKTKVKVEGREGSYVAGVGKFQKSGAISTTGNFVGKVNGSVTENAHISKRFGNQSSLQVPSSFTVEAENSMYNSMTTINGVSYSQSTTVGTPNLIAQQLFSFNIIEQIERKLGRIPGVDTAGKVAWLNANSDILKFNWHGYGSGPAGNKATLWIFRHDSSTWWNNPASHVTTASTVSLLTVSIAPANNSQPYWIGPDGFLHFLVNAEASDGVTASTINTDYVSLDISIKSTAVLDTRPQVLRVANFEGKVAGSTVENPHDIKRTVSSSTSNTALLTPTSGSWASADNAGSETDVRKLYSLDATIFKAYSTINGGMAQSLFSFDLIAEVERNIGRIPRSTVADKALWIENNLNRVSVNWHGYGSGPAGNKATVLIWNGSWSGNSYSTTSSSVVKVYVSRDISFAPIVDEFGFVHVLAHAEPSDGVTASTINTDYVELEIELKPEAILHDPIVPLYEVTTDDYNKILVDWNEATVLNRYPRVQGVQHLQNPYVIAEGENLLPPFYEWSLNQYAKVIAPYELELDTVSTWQASIATINVVGGQTISFSQSGNERFDIDELDLSGATIVDHATFIGNKTWTLNANTAKLYVRATNSTAGKYTFKNVMLNYGSTAKPFVPRNPSYLFAETKLGQIGTVKDVLFKDTDGWKVRKTVEKDVVIGSDAAFTNLDVGNGEKSGYKIVQFAKTSLSNFADTQLEIAKYDGKKLARFDTLVGFDNRSYIDYFRMGNGTSYIWISISDLESGWTETMAPTIDQIKAYFNGWKYTGNGTTHSWVSIVDGSAPATNTIDYVKANKAANYTPYKLSYVLATPQVITTNVEGDIAVAGVTQVEVGSGTIVREKATTFLTSGKYVINQSNATSYLKNKTNSIFNVYKNSQIDKLWTIGKNNSIGTANGGASAVIEGVNFDTTAEYTVTYLVLDRHLFTNNAQEVKAVYDGSLKSVVDSLVTSNADQETFISVNVKAIAELYKRVKALGG